MNSRREITFSATATVNLFECLVISGSPATGYLHAASFRDVRTLQMSLPLLREMWTRVDGLYIPKTDLESLHAMECTTAGSHVTDIPPCIAIDTRKMARYYVYLLFRYCVSAAEHSSLGARSQTAPTLRLTDIPTSWMQTVASTNYPSAPPMFTQSSSDVYHQQQHHPSEMTQMNIVQQGQTPGYVTHHAPQDGGPQRYAHQFQNVTGASQRHGLTQPATNRQQHDQPTSSHALYPKLPCSQPSNTEKRPQVTKRRIMGPYRSAAESDED